MAKSVHLLSLFVQRTEHCVTANIRYRERLTEPTVKSLIGCCDFVWQVNGSCCARSTTLSTFKMHDYTET